MLRTLDRVAIVVISGFVGLMALIPGWEIMADGSVYGFKLPREWLTAYWPFQDFFVAGLVLLALPYVFPALLPSHRRPSRRLTSIG